MPVDPAGPDPARIAAALVAPLLVVVAAPRGRRYPGRAAGAAARPATRPLPQLPIAVGEDGYFVATGDVAEPVGPAFWEMRANPDL